jgi:hypothetical protein
MFSKYFILFFILTVAFCGCRKDDIKFSIEPVISFVSISPASAMQYTDPVTITIHYEDGDGDLGENKDGVKNCFVTDNRVGVTYQFRIRQLAPLNANIPISGNLNIELGGQVMTDSSASQQASFTLHVADRAGHVSNDVTTSVITIHR